MMKSHAATLMASLLMTITFFGAAAGAQGLCSNVFEGLLEGPFESNHLQQVQFTTTRLGEGAFVVTRKSVEKKRLLLKPKIEISDWADYRKSHDRPGDIRWGAEFLPSALKEILGLKTLSASGQLSSPLGAETAFVQLPTAQTVASVYKQLETAMQKADPLYKILGFYVTGSKTVTGREYLERFALKSLLPFAKQGHLYEHDLNYHAFSSLLIPPIASKALRLRAEAFLDLLDFIGKKTATLPAILPLKKSLEKFVYENFVERLDTSTGNLFPALMLLKNESLSTQMSEVDVFLQLTFARQTSPQSYVETLLSREKFSPELSPILNEYFSQAPAKFKQEDLPKGFVENPAEFYNEAQSHIKDLNQAAENL